MSLIPVDALVKVGDRIELLSMGLDPNPIPVGEQGEVRFVTQLWGNEWQIGVKWDSGRTLNLAIPEDSFKVIPK